MSITNKYKRIKCHEIKIPEDRQRKLSLDTKDLEESIRKHGVLQPIIVDGTLTLIAGWRRLQASLATGQLDIPARFYEDLSPVEAKIIELEENLRRKDLEWQDQAKSLKQIHEAYGTLTPGWTVEQTADAVNIDRPTVSVYLSVADQIENPKVANASGLRAAYNMLSRANERKATDAISDLIEAGVGFVGQAISKATAAVTGQPTPTGTPAAPALALIPPTPVESLLNVNFKDWVRTYSGRPFNFIHCDFPYGTNVFGGKQSGRDHFTTYTDTGDVYWSLCEELCRNLDKIMAPNAHMIFWLPAEPLIQTQTIGLFERLAPSVEFWSKPLVWHKTDNSGIVSDARRGPRHVYETALFATRGDRPIVKVVSDVYGCHIDRTYHPSTKPEPMLRAFMEMVVDETTRLLDPTCGSGSALRAAESLGAAQVLGLEMSPEHFEAAKTALRKFRVLRKVSK